MRSRQHAFGNRFGLVPSRLQQGIGGGGGVLRGNAFLVLALATVAGILTYLLVGVVVELNETSGDAEPSGASVFTATTKQKAVTKPSYKEQRRSNDGGDADIHPPDPVGAPFVNKEGAVGNRQKANVKKSSPDQRRLEDEARMTPWPAFYAVHPAGAGGVGHAQQQQQQPNPDQNANADPADHRLLSLVDASRRNPKDLLLQEPHVGQEVVEQLDHKEFVSRQATIGPQNSDYIKWDGRVSHMEHGTIVFDWPGVKLSFAVTGAATVSIQMAWFRTNDQSSSQRFAVYVNGELVDDSIIDTLAYRSDPKTPNVYPVLKGVNALDPSKTYRIEIMKVSEAMMTLLNPNPNHLEMYYVIANGPSSPVAAANKHNQQDVEPHSKDPTFLPLSKVPKFSKTDRLKVEILGDSIVSGYCNMCDGQNFAHSFTNYACRELDAVCNTEAASALGLVTNGFPGRRGSLVTEFNLTLGSVQNLSPWTFSFFVPQVVVIAVGANDFVHKVADDKREEHAAKFEDAYVDFIRLIRAVYATNDDISFFLLCGPTTSAYCAVLERVAKRSSSITADNDIGARVFVVDLTNQLESQDTCCKHPNANGGKVLGKLVASNIRQALKLREDMGADDVKW